MDFTRSALALAPGIGSPGGAEIAAAPTADIGGYGGVVDENPFTQIPAVDLLKMGRPRDTAREKISGDLDELTDLLIPRVQEIINWKPDPKSVGLMERIFNPRYKLELAEFEQETKARMLNALLPSIGSLMEERRLIEQDPFLDTLQEGLAKETIAERERHARRQVVEHLRKTGVKLTAESEANFIHGSGVLRSVDPDSGPSVSDLATAYDLGYKSQNGEAVARQFADNPRLQALARIGALRAIEEAQSDTPWSPSYKTSADAVKAILAEADTVQQQGPKNPQVFPIKVQGAFGPEMQLRTQFTPAIPRDRAISLAAERLGVLDRLPELGLLGELPPEQTGVVAPEQLERLRKFRAMRGAGQQKSSTEPTIDLTGSGKGSGGSK